MKRHIGKYAKLSSIKHIMVLINKFVIYDTLATREIARKYCYIKASDYDRKTAQSHITDVKLKQPEVT